MEGKGRAQPFLARLIACPPRLIYGCKRKRSHQRTSRTSRNLRVRTRLRVLTPTPHDHIRGTCLRPQIPLIRILSLRRFFEEAHCCAGNPAVVARHQPRGDSEEAFAGFFGKVGLFENTLSGVDVGEVESGARVAGVKNAGEADAGGEGLYQDPVHFVIDDVADLAEVERVDYCRGILAALLWFNLR